jgi:hypothetical protein
MLNGPSHLFDIVEHSVRDFEDGLVDNPLI